MFLINYAQEHILIYMLQRPIRCLIWRDKHPRMYAGLSNGTCTESEIPESDRL